MTIEGTSYEDDGNGIGVNSQPQEEEEEADLLGLLLDSAPSADDPLESPTLQEMKGLTIVPTSTARSFEEVHEEYLELEMVALADDPLLPSLPPPPPAAPSDDVSVRDIQKGTVRPPVTARPPRRPQTLLLWISVGVGGLLVFAIFVTLIALLAQARTEEDGGDEAVDTKLLTTRLVAIDLLGVTELLRVFSLLDGVEAVCNEFFASVAADGVDEPCEMQSQALRRTFLQLIVLVSVENSNGSENDAADETTIQFLSDGWLLLQNKTALAEDLRKVDPFFNNLDDVTLTLLPDFPTAAPSNVPSLAPSSIPSAVPSLLPSSIPSPMPTPQPTPAPTRQPTRAPVTLAPVTMAPVLRPPVVALTAPVAVPSPVASPFDPFGRHNGTNDRSSPPAVSRTTMAPTTASNIFRNPSAEAPILNTTTDTPP